jgi:hypothetical protein
MLLLVVVDEDDDDNVQLALEVVWELDEVGQSECLS